MIALYQNAFGTKPYQKYFSLLEAGDHPKIDDSEFLDAQQTQPYQSLIRTLQWVITIRWSNVDMVAMTLPNFHAMP